ncbi:DUF1206 domain-containing protein [Aequorivita marisscotiae]|uniref:DUF1206 domain-containing protein n=1 Tax=Aequorivita marisscotiae TaxID=3040348 RepID=A0ABY8KUY2_9FLAO|nr:DUF1206 domain-containing protein [Aequorivita sp. Ant34-E75]WGF92951.1 DUF1206 domain-containing protein [Aequorivita sp. Ant34-E75]
MKKSFKTIAYIGFVSKGLIYLVIGTLSLLAALNMGGESTGTNSALSFLKKQPFGQVLLMLLGVGLICYSAWMYVQSIKDPENIGSDTKGKLKRFIYFFNGLVYTVIAGLAFYHLFGSTGSKKSDTAYLDFLGPTTLTILFIVVGVVLTVQAVALIIGVIKGHLLDRFNLEGATYSHLIKILGKFGYYARAFVVAILAYFFLRAGIYTDNNEIKGIQDAFSFLHTSGIGGILMAITAVGFISYGTFYILLTRFRTFEER